MDLDKHFDKIVWYNPCRSFIAFDKDYKYSSMGIIDFFVNDVTFYETFLKNIKINKFGDNNTYFASAINSVLFLLTKNNQYNNKNISILSESLEPSYFCPVNLSFINKIIKQIDMKQSYEKFYVDLLFNNTNVERIKYKDISEEYTDCIIVPNTTNSCINKKMIDIVTRIKSKMNNKTISYTPLSSISFVVIIKPDDYNELQKEYANIKDTQELYKFYEKLRQTEYISPYHIIAKGAELYKTDKLKHQEYYNKFARIRDNIYSFYDKKLGITNMDECISINIQTFYPQNLWIDISVTFRNIYESEYNYIRLINYHGSILYRDFLNCMKFGDNLDNKYMTSFKDSMIKKYNLTVGLDDKDCLTSVYNIMSNTKKEITNENSSDLIINGKLINFTVKKVFLYKIAKTGAICSHTVCMYANDKHYLITIVPNTINFLNNIYNTNVKNKEIRKLLANINTSQDNFCNDNLCFYFIDKCELKYRIEIIEMNCYDCEMFKKECELNEFEMKNYATFNNEVYLPFIENNIVANKLHKVIAENFKTMPGIITFNILYNLHIHDITDDIILNKLKTLYQKIDNKYILGLLNNKNSITVYDKDLQFICVDAEEYVLIGGNENFRRVIWFVGLITKSKQELSDLVDTFISIMNEKDKSDISLKLSDYARLLNVININENINEYFENYLFNAYSLYDSNGDFTDMKHKLDTFIRKLKGDDYLYIFYHYHNALQYCTLHLHVVNRYNQGLFPSKVLTRLSRKIASYQSTDERVYYETNDYFKMSKYSYFRHTFRVVMNINKLKHLRLKSNLDDLNYDDTVQIIKTLWTSHFILTDETVKIYANLLCKNPINTLYADKELILYNNTVMKNFLIYYSRYL